LDGKIKAEPAAWWYVVDLEHDLEPSFLKPCWRPCQKTAVFCRERQTNVQIHPQQAIAHVGEERAGMGYSAAEFAGFLLDARFWRQCG
jgi:hypothetical protein